MNRDTTKTSVLDYAPPPPALWQRVAHWMFWFFLRRRLGAIEVVIGGWLLMVTLYALAGYPVYYALARYPVYVRNALIRTLLYSLYPTVSCVTLIAFGVLLVRGRWRAAILAIIVALSTGVVGGMFRTDRCPHATYLNVGGMTFTVSGKACHNSRYFVPWWEQ